MHALLVHGWKGFPENAWFPWLRRELEAQGMTTEAPQLPEPFLPDRKKWVALVKSKIKSPKTVVVAHSLGVPTTLFALEEYDGPPLEHVVCVSGFARPYPIPGLGQWFNHSKLDFDRIRGKAKRWTVIHAKNDPLVPYAEGKWLAEQLGVPIVKNMKFHMNQFTACYELPEVLDAIGGGS
jgi:uncharacterized protein